MEQREGTRDLSALAERIRTKEAVVGVIGLGYVGLPLLVAARRAGYPVVGLDTDEWRIRTLHEGRSYLTDVSDSEVETLDAGSLSTTEAILQSAEVLTITVPTPLVDQAPDLSFVEAAAEAAGRTLSRGNLVILESTTYPGTTEEVVMPLLEKHSGLTAGDDFALAYSPERINPGQEEYGVEDIPKVVGGLTERCRDLAVSFYQGFIRQVVATAGPREAEMAKLIENTFRQVNIALVNELATIAPAIGVDIWEALDAAATKPFGYLPFWPGPGVGGHCIAIDPSYLSWKVEQRLGFGIGFVQHARSVNNRMPAYVAARVGEALNRAGKPMRGARLVVLGLAYKPGVDDVRESPALSVVHQLIDGGADCAYHDPYVPSINVSRRRAGDVPGAANGTATGERIVESQPLGDALLARADCVIILTPHPDIDYEWVARTAPLVFDATGITRTIRAESVIRL
jgi:UDP-N-acetyl-D-glucosamine dehydrogenase